MSRMKTMIAVGSLVAGLSSFESSAVSANQKNIQSEHTKQLTAESILGVMGQSDLPTLNDFKKQGLESLVFNDTGDISFLRERLSFTTFITPQIVQRDTFNSLKGNFLVKMQGEKYVLYLPDSMRISELPAIIKKVNLIAFGERLPEYASTVEIKKEIISTIKYLFSQKNETNKEEINKAVKKYYELFQRYAPGENPDLSIKTQKADEWYLDELDKLPNDPKLIKNIEEVMASSLYQHFLEAFFELGSEMVSHVDNIRTNLGMEELKKELTIVRKTKNKETIAKKEKEIGQKIATELYSFYKRNRKNGRKTRLEESSPSKIMKSDMANCVGVAIIGHQLLSELGIAHEAMITFNHIALSMKLSNGKSYLINSQSTDEFLEITVLKKNYNSVFLRVGNETRFMIEGDAEKFLMSSILRNKSEDIELKNKRITEQAVVFLEKSLSLYGAENNSIFLFTLASGYNNIGKYDDGLRMIDKAIALSPEIREYRYEKQNLLEKLKIFDERYEEAEKMVEKYQHIEK